MRQMTGQFHGGDRYRNNVRLDFSVNTNPLGLPDYVRQTLQETVSSSPDICFEYYPDPECDRLRAALAVHHGVAKENILCGNGASELIYAAVNAIDRYRKQAELRFGDGHGAVKVILPVPSFGEYERALQAAGADIRYYILKEKDKFAVTEDVMQELTPDVDMLFLCSPGNPAGNLIPEALLHEILDVCGKNGIFVLLDECFLELAVSENDGDGSPIYGYCGIGGKNEKVPGGRIRGLTDRYSGLVLLKAFTKLYAMPGLRLGYCISGNADLLCKIKGQQPCWNVSGIAQIAGMTVLDNYKTIDYISQTQKAVARERRFLAEELDRLEMQVLPGCANFICFYYDRLCGDNLYEKLLEKEILIRDCSNYKGMGKGWYRIAVRPHEENEILIKELEKLAKEQ